ncbi:MAG: helix-turn-helix domain-containing protein, partial [Nitratireductor sp.]
MENDDRVKRSRGRPRAFNRTQQGGSVQSLDRAVAILKRVADANGLSLSEIASAMGQAPSTVYRVLITLQKHGIVEFEKDTQLWFVGLEAFRIGSTFLGRTSMVEQIRPVMQELMASTGLGGRPPTASVMRAAASRTSAPYQASLSGATRTDGPEMEIPATA